MGQVWATNSLGGFQYSDQLSDTLRHALQPAVKFRQFCDVGDAFGKHRGENYHWNVYGNVANQGGTLNETNTMPETQYTITQGTLTVTEYGNSVPYTGKLDDLSIHAAKQVINKALRHDAKKAFDIGAHAQFNLAPIRITAVGTASTVFGTAGTAPGTNSVAWGTGNHKEAVDYLKEFNGGIPPYVADDYYAIAWPAALRTFKNQLETIFQYSDPGFGMIMNGEIGRYEHTRFIEQTHIPKGGATDSTTWDAESGTADAWNTAGDWIFYLGEDTVMEGVACPEEIRGKIPTDYGRSKGIAWYYLGGFGIVHTTAAPADARIAKVDSAV